VRIVSVRIRYYLCFVVSDTVYIYIYIYIYIYSTLKHGHCKSFDYGHGICWYRNMLVKHVSLKITRSNILKFGALFVEHYVYFIATCLYVYVRRHLKTNQLYFWISPRCKWGLRCLGCYAALVSGFYRRFGTVYRSGFQTWPSKLGPVGYVTLHLNEDLN
jgi:hypothetical protein